MREKELKQALEHVAGRIIDCPRDRLASVIHEHALGMSFETFLRRLSEFRGTTVCDLIEMLRTRNINHANITALDVSGMHLEGNYSVEMMKVDLHWILRGKHM